VIARYRLRGRAARGGGWAALLAAAMLLWIGAVPAVAASDPVAASMRPTITGPVGELHKGLFLVASRSLMDPNFQETVILLVDHGADGTRGLIVNRPTDIPFTDQGDFDRGGDLPFRDVISATAEDLDAYWSSLLTEYQPVEHITPFDPNRALPVCDGQKLPESQAVNGIAYCGETRTIAYDRRLLPDVYQRSGDFGVAVVIATEWALAMQQDADVTGDPRRLELQQSCFTGSWAGDVVRGGHNPDGLGLTLSAGDLDEAIQSFLIFRDTDKISAGIGATAFENVDAFRTGFFQGEPECATLVP